MKKCKFCGKAVTFKNSGIWNDLFAMEEQEKLDSLRLKKEEVLCVDCKREIMFANLIPIL